jgi:hypothetical protein
MAVLRHLLWHWETSHFVLSVCLWLFCNSENEQRLFPRTALTAVCLGLLFIFMCSYFRRNSSLNCDCQASNSYLAWGPASCCVGSVHRKSGKSVAVLCTLWKSVWNGGVAPRNLKLGTWRTPRPLIPSEKEQSVHIELQAAWDSETVRALWRSGKSLYSPGIEPRSLGCPSPGWATALSRFLQPNLYRVAFYTRNRLSY